MSTSITATAKLPFRTKLSYGLGSIAFGIKDHGFNTFLMLYYNQIVGLPAAWVGTAIMIAMLCDAVIDPFIGHSTDRLRTRWGRRHPFMYASAIPIALAYVLLWNPPAAGQMLQLAWLLATSVAVRVAIALYEIPSATLMAEFTTDYNERTSLSTWRSLFFAIGMVGMGVISLKVFLVPTAEQPVGQLNAAGYTHYALAAAAVMLFSVLISSWGTHSRIPSLIVPDKPRAEGYAELWRGMKTILTDHTYASILLFTLFFSIVGGLATGLGVYVNTFFWRLNSEHLASIAGATGLGVILALIVVQLSKRFGKKETVLVLIFIALLSSLVPTSLGLMGLMPKEMSALLPLLLIKNILLVTCMLAAIILSASMAADVSEHFQLKTGKRMEGLIFAAFVMILKAVSGLGVFLSGLVLAFVHFPEKATPDTVDPAIVHELVVIFMGGITVFCLLSLIALSFYPITRARHQQMLAELEARKQDAALALATATP